MGEFQFLTIASMGGAFIAIFYAINFIQNNFARKKDAEERYQIKELVDSYKNVISRIDAIEKSSVKDDIKEDDYNKLVEEVRVRGSRFHGQFN